MDIKESYNPTSETLAVDGSWVITDNVTISDIIVDISIPVISIELNTDLSSPSIYTKALALLEKAEKMLQEIREK